MDGFPPVVATIKGVNAPISELWLFSRKFANSPHELRIIRAGSLILACAAIQPTKHA